MKYPNSDSFSRSLIVVPRPKDVKTQQNGQKAFRYMYTAPTLGNALPDAVKESDSISSFRRHLKTLLLHSARCRKGIRLHQFLPQTPEDPPSPLCPMP